MTIQNSELTIKWQFKPDNSTAVANPQTANANRQLPMLIPNCQLSTAAYRHVALYLMAPISSHTETQTEGAALTMYAYYLEDKLYTYHTHVSYDE